ncbi:MAG: hypothetical protein M1828_000245 [Chrysothrix sp. TS-e1954]|nr:MAG: hypothetical protein M1828_000245 [Chrysothrix sp. TS-e1954]
MAERLYAICKSPGSGRHMHAEEYITMGSLIVEQPPIFQLRNDRELTAARLDDALHELTIKDRAFFDRLSPRPADAQQKFSINSFAYYSGGLGFDGIFRTIYFVNHSCLPNAVAAWMPDRVIAGRRYGGTLRLHACANIDAGEQITINYGAANNTTTWPDTAARQHDLLRYGFTCTCVVCTDTDATNASEDSRDERYVQLAQMQHDLTQSRMNWTDKLDIAEEYVGLVEEELGGIVPGTRFPLYVDAKLSQA